MQPCDGRLVFEIIVSLFGKHFFVVVPWCIYIFHVVGLNERCDLFKIVDRSKMVFFFFALCGQKFGSSGDGIEKK